MSQNISHEEFSLGDDLRRAVEDIPVPAGLTESVLAGCAAKAPAPRKSRGKLLALPITAAAVAAAVLLTVTLGGLPGREHLPMGTKDPDSDVSTAPTLPTTTATEPSATAPTTTEPSAAVLPAGTTKPKANAKATMNTTAKTTVKTTAPATVRTTAPSADKTTTTNKKIQTTTEGGTTKIGGITQKGETTKKGVTTTKGPTTKKTRPHTDVVKRSIVIASGTTKLETVCKDAFRGKTYTAVTWQESDTAAFAEELAAFGKQYGCTVKLETKPFDQVRAHLVTRLHSGNAADIVRMHGAWYPRILIANLLDPLNKAFTTADTGAGGIDLAQSTFFAWSDHLYTVTTAEDSPIYYLYYNKKLLSGASDPWTLYQNGQWNWQKMRSVAAGFTGENGVFFSDRSLFGKCLPLSNNVQFTAVIPLGSRGASERLSANFAGNARLIRSLQMMQGMLGLGGGTGMYAPQNVILGGAKAVDPGDLNDPAAFISGKIAVWVSGSDRYVSLYKRIAQGGAGVQITVDDLGVAPVPLGPDNTAGAYPAGWPTGFAAAHGSKEATAPQAVAALCKFHAGYRPTGGTATDKAATAAESAVRTRMAPLFKTANRCDLGYGAADGTLADILMKVEDAVCAGGDAADTLASYQDMADAWVMRALSCQ